MNHTNILIKNLKIEKNVIKVENHTTLLKYFVIFFVLMLYYGPESFIYNKHLNCLIRLCCIHVLTMATWTKARSTTTKTTRVFFIKTKLFKVLVECNPSIVSKMLGMFWYKEKVKAFRGWI